MRKLTSKTSELKMTVIDNT